MSSGSLAAPPVHLWIYNHPLHGISDQIEFYLSIMRQNGYRAGVGRQPRQDALNIVIENFSDATSGVLRKFCRDTGKRVAVIMTEHLDFIDQEIYIHGSRLWSDNDYMHPATQFARIRHLMDCACHIRGFFVLGDLPELLNMQMMLPGIAIRTLPFPRLARPAAMVGWDQLPADFAFTGAATRFREEVLQLVRTRLTVEHPGGFLSRKARDNFSRTGRVVLNIPQRVDWKWLSLMRVIAALRCGRATVSLGTNDTSQIAKCCLQLDIAAPELLGRLAALAARGEEIFEVQFADYHAMAEAFLREHAFPRDFFEYWAVTEL
ncbi:MAG: hypothetical protein B7Z80_21025 [Rhodospirillales bacterium 20-64-7]|nr:MAG: hypothetical protein B7Z80_21025 [Rhodospirillales bacterium 20-64-7]